MCVSTQYACAAKCICFFFMELKKGGKCEGIKNLNLTFKNAYLLEMPTVTNMVLDTGYNTNLENKLTTIGLY